MDITVRKVMMSANSLHPRSAVECLYLPHHLGSRDLLGMENLYHRHLIMLSNHLQTSDDVVVKMCLLLDMSLPSRKLLCSRANKLVEALSLDVDLVHIVADDMKNLVCDQQRACLWKTLCEKPLHGKFVNWCSSNSVDMSRSFQWLSKTVVSQRVLFLPFRIRL